MYLASDIFSRGKNETGLERFVFEIRGSGTSFKTTGRNKVTFLPIARSGSEGTLLPIARSGSVDRSKFE
jgi:hypothetical protein